MTEKSYASSISVNFECSGVRIISGISILSVKKFVSNYNIKKGNVVLITDDNGPRVKWYLGVIVDIPWQ